jgi:NAD(P)-dependent dehydrogenase (short-subunit alcohol dehydrogenase family)
MKKRVVVVTGAFGTLGSAVALKFLGLNDKVILVDKAGKRPPALRKSTIAENEIYVGWDLSNADSTNQLVKDIHKAHGAIDVLVNVAGAFRAETVLDGSQDTWDFLYSVNLRTVVNMCRATLPVLNRTGAGRIVNVGANAAQHAGAGMGAYAASKSGVHRLTEALAIELKGQATVNAVLPGVMDTPLNRAEMPNVNFSTWVQPDEMAGVIAFLASDAARAITGALIPVTGLV